MAEHENLIPRDYQVELMNISLRQNTIIYLPTGSGKTFIALLILKRMAQPLEKAMSEGGKISVFLVNTVTLVDQHTNYLKRQTPFNVGAYTGDMNVDYWTKEHWAAEFDKYQVFVMTAQIFVNIISNSFLSLENVNLIIFDECHHAVCDHTMRQMMKQFQDVSNPPRVLALTATLLNGNCKLHQVLKKVQDLEITYHSKVATVDEFQKVIGYSTNPTELVKVYESHSPIREEEIAIVVLEGLIDTLNALKPDAVDVPKVQAPNLVALQSGSPYKEIISVIKDTIVHMEMFGVYGGKIALMAHSIQLERMRTNCTVLKFQSCLNAAISIFHIIMRKLERKMEGTSVLDKIMHFSSDKIIALLKIFKDFNEKSAKKLYGIIFVQRRFTAKVLYHILKSLNECGPEYSNISPDFVVGFNNNPNVFTRESVYVSKVNRKVIDSFKNNEVNILVATNVIEEGVDVPECTFVCKFDEPKDYRSYIQSKGRARHKDSFYYMMVERGNYEKFKEKYHTYRETENILNRLLIGKNEERRAPKDMEIQEMYEEDELPTYYVNGPGSAYVNMVSAVSLLCRYCMSLPADLYTVHQPNWYYQMVGKKFKIFIELPTICPILEPVEGTPMFNKRNAKRAAALKACTMIHQIGELNDSLLPTERTNLQNTDFIFPHWPEQNEKGVGNTKTRRRHRRQIPICTLGKIIAGQPLYLHIIELKPKFSSINISKILHNLYTGRLCFGVLSAKKLPAICAFPIYVTQGEIGVDLLVNHSQVLVTPEQLQCIYNFNFLIYNDILQILKSFLVVTNSDGETTMFCVPVSRDDDYAIDFDLLEKNKELKNRYAEPSKQDKLNLNVDDESYLGKIVTPWYRADDTDYIVTEVSSLNAYSKFPSNTIGSFMDYYTTRYSLTLVNPTLSLLTVKPISSRLTCIKPRDEGKKRKKDTCNHELDDVQLIPELCIMQQFPASLWLQAKLLPTILHRVMQLFRCEELRVQICHETNIGRVQVDKWLPITLKSEAIDSVQLDDSVNNELCEKDDDVEVVALDTLDLNKDFSSKMLERQYPWLNEEEPVDIDRSLTVTLADIKYYEAFVQKKLSSTERNLRNDIQHNSLAIEYDKPFVHKPIASINDRAECSGPQLKDVFEALCASKANEVVNLERLETLGDSFLKLTASMYVILRFPKYDEGKATILKCKLVSNKNLYYLGLERNIGGILKFSDFEPKSQWTPPGFNLPRQIKEMQNNRQFNPKWLYRVYIPQDEQITGISEKTLKHVQSDDLKDNDDFTSDECQSSQYFFGYQNVSDKTIADVMEAILGLYYQSCGFSGGLKMLEWLGIIPESERIENLLQMKPPSPVLNQNSSQKDVDFHIPSWRKLEEKLGYHFNDRGFLLQALSHASYSPNRLTSSYERLEFVGDAVLDFLITCCIYESCGELSPGELTDLRSALVNNITFACFTVRCEFHKFLLTMNSKLQADIDKFVLYQENKGFTVDDDVLILLNENDLHMAENVDCPKILGDVFESLAGAVYLDCGMDLNTVWRVFYKIMWKEIDMFSQNVPKNAIRLLNETPGTHPQFQAPLVTNATVMVKLDFMLEGTKKRVYGFGDNKHLAKKAAAKIALRLLPG